MAIPFRMILKERINKGIFNEIEATQYFQEDPFFNNLTEEKMITIIENKDIYLEFDAGSIGARLYMDTLDYYNQSICREDENGNIFIDESKEIITLFSNAYDNENKTNFYPFVPGSYRIHVEANGRIFYAYLNVEPKQMSKPELNSMRTEIEGMIENLAHDMIKHESASHDKSNLDTDVSIATQILRLMHDYSKWIGLIEEIKNSPRFKIAKTYHMESSTKVRIVDQETIKHRLKQPDTLLRMYVPKRYITHNLPENQVIIQSIKYFLKIGRKAVGYLNKIIPMIDKSRESLVVPDKGRYHHYRGLDSSDNLVLRQMKASQEANNQLMVMRRLVSTCTQFLHSNWVKEVQVKPIVTSGLYLDIRYRKLYQLFREIKNLKKKIKLDSSYAYYWKRTNLLYEMWGYIRFIKALQSDDLGFKPIRGWIYGNQDVLDTLEIPFLESGTSIKFQHKTKNMSINLVYDTAIPNNKRLTTFDKPLYTEFPQNRPDTRLDVYLNDRYELSFIAEFKYRPSYTIGSVGTYSKEGYAYSQLLHYSKFNSLFVGKESVYEPSFRKYERAFQPVPQVWVLYPNFGMSENGNVKVGDWLTKIPYSPNEDLSKLIELVFSGLKYLEEDEIE
jgi:hypothetical protein